MKKHPLNAKAVCSVQLAQEISSKLSTKSVQLEENRNGVLSFFNLVVTSVFVFQEILNIKTDKIHLKALNAFIDPCTGFVHLAPVSGNGLKQVLKLHKPCA